MEWGKVEILAKVEEDGRESHPEAGQRIELSHCTKGQLSDFASSVPNSRQTGQVSEGRDKGHALAREVGREISKEIRLQEQNEIRDEGLDGRP